MTSILDKIKSEPAVVIGVIAACVLAVVQTLNGYQVISDDIAGTIGRALDPTRGWAIPIVVAIITRFFVSPAEKPGL
jgi:hypothetical protein